MIYNPAAWYWFVAGDDSRAWSSAANAYIEISDVPSGVLISRILNEAELRDVLQAYGLQGPAGVPPAVTDIQARMALLAADLLPAVEAAVASAGGDAAIYWERSLVIHRDSPFIAAMGAALGLTGEQIDGLFVAAAQL